MLGVRGRQYDLPSIWADHFEGKNRLKSFAYAGARERCRCNGAPGRLCHIRWPYACCLVLLDAVALEWHGDHAVEIATGCVEINVTFGEARANPGLAKPRRWSAAANARTTPTIPPLYLIVASAAQCYWSTPAGLPRMKRPSPAPSPWVQGASVFARVKLTSEGLSFLNKGVESVDRISLVARQNLAACYGFIFGKAHERDGSTHL